MDVKEKLVELCEDLETLPCCDTYEAQAEYLISNGVTVQEWISVEDRLPENDGSYLVTINSFGGRKYIDVRWFAKDGEAVDEYELAGQENVWYYYDSEWGYISVDSITNWMPLPQLPNVEHETEQNYCPNCGAKMDGGND